MPETILITNRLKLRLWYEDDTEPFIKLNNDPEVMRFFPSIQTADETLQQIARIKKHFTDYGYGLYAVERLDNQQFIGYTGFAHPSFQSYFTPCVEVGWRLSRENWGQGFATEAAIACINHGFTTLGFNEIYSFTAVINLPSINVMKKSGLEYIGEFEHPALPDGHRLKTHVLYKIDAKAKN
jgi:RimJ/RimL family protein N-acetyltransferase